MYLWGSFYSNFDTFWAERFPESLAIGFALGIFTWFLCYGINRVWLMFKSFANF